MSTRAARESATKQNELHRLILTRILNEEGNRVCADCNERMPRWASWSLGIFFCLKCSGVHRSLGVHISKVKSVNLDTWTRDQVNHIAARGNVWANKYYLDRHAKGPSFRIAEGDFNLNQYIRNKYEHKKYMRQGKAPELVDRSELIAKCEQEIYGVASTKITAKKKSQPKVLLNNINAVQQQTTTTTVKRPQATNQPQKVSNDLLNIDFGDFAASTPITNAQSNPTASAGDPFDFFGSSAVSTTTPVQNNNTFVADFGQMNINNNNSNNTSTAAISNPTPTHNSAPPAAATPQNNNDLFDVFNSAPTQVTQQQASIPQSAINAKTEDTSAAQVSSSAPSGNSQIMDIMSLYGKATTNTQVQASSSAAAAPTTINNDLSSLGASFGMTSSQPAVSKNNTNNDLNFDPFAPVSDAGNTGNGSQNIDFGSFGSNPFGSAAAATTTTNNNNDFVWN